MYAIHLISRGSTKSRLRNLPSKDGDEQLVVVVDDSCRRHCSICFQGIVLGSPHKLEPFDDEM